MRAPPACVLAAMLGALPGCAQDLVLANHAPPPEKSDAAQGGGADATRATDAGSGRCDVDSAECVDGQAALDWTCGKTECSPTCTDGVVGDGPDCKDAHRDSACDMTGFWAVRETLYLRDMILGDVQVSSNWYLYEIAQQEDDFQIVSELDCGVHVTGSETIDYPPPTAKALLWLNAEDGSDPMRSARRGTSTISGGGCAVSLERWYFIRGATSAYLPADFSGDTGLTSLLTLPSVTNPIDGGAFPDGAVALTTPGIPGAGFLLTGFIQGERYSAQRTWAAWSTTSPVAQGALEIVVPGSFDLDENVLRVTSCGDGCELALTLAYPATDLTPHVTMEFIGKTLGSERVGPVVVAQPRVDSTLDLETCANIKTLLPHDGTIPQ